MELPKKDKKIPEFELSLFKKSLKFFENAVLMLKENISNNIYDAVVGDDVSGRLPTLVLYGVIKKICSKNKVDAPKLLFFKGNRGGWKVSEEDVELWKKNMQKELERYVQEKTLEKGSKILIVTEYNQTNNTILNFNEVFGKAGIGFDVLDLQRHINTPYFREGEIKVYDAGIVQDRIGSILFWNSDDKELTGVKKKKDSDVFVQANKEADKKDVKKAREDVKKMIDYLFKYYEQNIG